ncbi:MAG: hypothetical protein ACRDV2_10625, partial [Actinomycetes bacterium]
PSPIAAWELTLGDGGWAYQITTPDFTSLVVGFRTANASAVLAFETDQFSFEEALKLADLARQRMTEVFGA